MRSRMRIPFLPTLLGAALLGVACTDSLDPKRPAPEPPRFAAASASGGIALDQFNGSLGESGTLLIKGFNPTNPHLGDAILATFFWIGSPLSGNVITSVTDDLADGTPVGNTYQLVDFVASSDVAMATYLATNVQNFPEGTFPDGGKVLRVKAILTQPVVDGGLLITAWTGVAGLPEQALGAFSSGAGSGVGPTIADPGAIPVDAGALAYGITMSNAVVGLDGPGGGWTEIGSGSDLFMKNDGEYDAEFTVSSTAGMVDPQWTWHLTLPGTWLATVLALNPPPEAPATGDLTVTTSTTGSSPDPDGYTVTVDGTTSQPIPDDGSVTFTGLSAGDHSVELSDVATNCAVSEPNPQVVTVPPGGTATADFAITCATTPGKTTGGGKLGDRRDFATFGFEASAAGGTLEWVQHCVDGADPASPTCAAGGFNFHGTVTAGSYAPVSDAPNCRTWTGTGSVKFKDDPSRNGSVSFTVNAACDNGTPGRGTDSIDIAIGDYHAAGLLTGGNIQTR